MSNQVDMNLIGNEICKALGLPLDSITDIIIRLPMNARATVEVTHVLRAIDADKLVDFVKVFKRYQLNEIQLPEKTAADGAPLPHRD